jgi:hypothetical protein
MDKKFSFSGIASNPASGINNIDLNVAGADGSGMSSDSSGVTKKEMIDLLRKVVQSENSTLREYKTDLEEIIERIKIRIWIQIVSLHFQEYNVDTYFDF